MAQEKMSARQENVAQKMKLILTSALKVSVDSIFGETSLEYTLNEVLDYYLSDSKTNYKGLSIQKNLLELHLVLAPWAEGRIFLTSENTRQEIQHLATIEDFRGQKRISKFLEICKDEGIEADILFDEEKYFSHIEKTLKKIGIFAFPTNDIPRDLQKMGVTLDFAKKFSATFCVSYSDCEKFLVQVKDFAEKNCSADFKSSSEFFSLIENSPLREFWLITKQVVRAWMKESKNNEIPFSRLVKNLDDGLFEANWDVAQVALPEGIKKIPDSLFKNCQNLKSVTLPESVEEIGDKAFYGCESLESVNFPKNLKSIGYEAFAFCSNLHFLEESPKNCVVEYNAFDMIGNESDEEAAYFDDYGYDDSCGEKYLSDVDNFTDYDNAFYDEGDWD